MRDKVSSIEQVMSKITAGMTIMVGGFMGIGSPTALMQALATGPADALTIICNDAARPDFQVGKVVAAGKVKEYIASHIGLNPQLGKMMADDQVRVTLVPQGTLVEQIRAAGAGLGGVLTPTGVGTEVAVGKEIKNIAGKDYLIELPLGGDVALLKAHKVDRGGNAVFRASARNFNPIMATACSYVAIEAEEIVETGQIEPDQVMLPGIFVNAVVAATVS